jgi:hypothetical protein
MLEILLNNLRNNIGQLTVDEYKYIIPFLGKSNFLVFGTGNDSELWNYANRDGKTIFLENQEEWIKPEYKNVIKVDYTCKITDYKKLLDEFKKQSGLDVSKDKTAIQRLREAAEKAKIELSSA